MNSMTMQTKKGKCIVKNCKNSVTVKIKRGDKENAMKVTYHRFPKDPKRRQKWADALQLKIENVTDNHRVCSIHFFETAFDKRLPCKIRLRENAIPFYFHQIKSEHDNHKNCIKLEANHFSPETQNQYPANQRILKRSPSFILNESDKKRMNTLEIEKLPEVEGEKRLDSRNKICVDRATSVSPERFNSPTMKRIRKRFVEKIIIEKKEKKRIYNKLRLAQAKNASMEKEIAKLREEKLLSEKQLNDLKVMDNVLKRAVAKVKHEKLPRVYNPELRSFALTMHFYSPAAYTYLRHKFHSALPHPKTISKWYRVVHGEPGICSEALDIIKKRAEEAEYPLLVSFMFDGMHIMKNCDKDGKGLVNFGKSIPLDNNETPTLAREALVFLVNCINQSWKIPVAYFLIDHLSGKEIAGLINQCLVALHDSKVKVVSLTFDGTAANIAAVKSLIISNNTDTPNSDKENETDNSIDDYKWWFKHPVTQEEIYVFLDPCHMLKLIRNTLGSEKMLRDGNGGLIGWKFVTMLHEMQVYEGMHLGNKLRTAHINYVKQKMKVRLAAQVFSKSVAAALKVCRNDLKLCEFFNCGPTIQFIEQVNDLF